MEPRSGSLEGISNTVDLFISDYARESDIIRNLVDMSYNDYSTALHSINVMAFALGFAAHMSYSPSQTKNLGLCALLHDVGKCKIRKDILSAPRRLTDEEFKEMKCHTTIGNDILKGCLFGDKDIARTALEHHEKLDGSGYPLGKTNISETARIIGVIDCYEALTNDSRPYRDGMNPFDCLKRVIGKDTIAGKFDRDIYGEFVQSLSGEQRRNALSIRLEALDTFSAHL
jgi:HD-GYP domain-containing protein (c-di-GMP phosphodiesterase class II)